jgi:hypothetical protein
MNNETSLFAPEEFLQVPPTLACAIGLNEAIVAQRLYWLLRYPQNGKELNGHRWIYNTYSQWKRDFFPFWSEDTIKRIFNSLEGKNIVISCQPEKNISRRKYYRVSEAAIKFLTMERYEKSRSGQIAPFGTGQIALIEKGRKHRSYYKESTNIPKESNSTLTDSTIASQKEAMASPEDVAEAERRFSEMCDYKKGLRHKDDDSSPQDQITNDD